MMMATAGTHGRPGARKGRERLGERQNKGVRETLMRLEGNTESTRVGRRGGRCKVKRV